MERIVVVIEDDGDIAALVEMYLRRAGFRPLLAPTGERGVELAVERQPVLVVVDVGLPGIDGFEVCRLLRRRSDVPVLFLTARDAEVDRVEGFARGGDDYVVKPFSPAELVARVEAIVRRGRAAPQEETVFALAGGVRLDVAGRTASVDGSAVALTGRELDLLAFLARNRCLALSRRQLIDGVWGPDFDGDERTVDVHVRQLRRKLGPALALATVWGHGYRLG